MTTIADLRNAIARTVDTLRPERSRDPPVDDPHGDYQIDDASLCEMLDDDLRDDIAKLGDARGQTSAGVVWAAVKQLRDREEGRIIEFENARHARGYYRHSRKKELELEGALDDLEPEAFDEYTAESVRDALNMGLGEVSRKARAAARWLDVNDPETHVEANEHGAPEAIPAIDEELAIQHGVAEEGDGA